jgi:TIR domain-containing protein
VWTAVGSCAGIVAAAAAIVPLAKSRKPRANAALPAPPTASSGALAPSGSTGAISHNVFVSYSSDDQAWVDKFVSALHLKGATVVYDKLIMGPGKVIVHTLDEAIRASANGLLVYSQAAIANRWVNEEYAALMQKAIQDDRLFIPVIIEDVPLPPFAEIRYSADFRNADAATYDRLVDQIARAVTRPLPVLS